MKEPKYPAYLPLSYNQMFDYIFGLVYLAVGFAGFAATNHIAFSATSGGRELQFFSVNPLHNYIHIAVGATLMLAGFAGPAISRGVNVLVGAVYLLLAVAGPFLVGSSANVLGLNAADHLLHLATGVLALTVAIFVGGRDPLQRRTLAR